MTLAEASRLYQATLTAVRSAEAAGTVEEFMREELEDARRTLETAWLRHTVEG